MKIADYNLLFSSWHNRCYLFAKSYIHDDEAAKDIVSESFMDIWDISQNKKITTPHVLLFTIVKRKALNYLKRELAKKNMMSAFKECKQRELEIQISTLEACEPEEIYSMEIQQIINTTLSRFSTMSQNVFEMVFVHGKSKKEIAYEYKISVKGVDHHIYRVLDALKRELKNHGYTNF